GRPGASGLGRGAASMIGVALAIVGVLVAVKANWPLYALVPLMFVALTLLVFALLFLVMPLAIKRKQWFDPMSPHHPLDPGSRDLKDDDAEFFEATLSALAHDGFELTRMVRNSEFGPGTSMCAAYFENRREDTHGYAVSHRTPVGQRDVAMRTLC